VRSASLVLLTAGCWGTSATPATVAPPAVAAEVPASVSKLFEQGKTWTFTTKVTIHTHDFSGPQPIENKTMQAGQLTCEVTASTPRPQGRNSRLTCTASPPLPTPFPTELAATPSGLWRLVADATLDPKARLLEEPPTLSRSDEHFVEGASTSQVTSDQPGRWCIADSYGGMGQSGGWLFCLRGGDLVGGVSTADDGTTATTVEWGEHDEPGA
jgi:hypothetical protein